MKRNYGLLLLVALLGILPMQAQYVKNGSFEEGLNSVTDHDYYVTCRELHFFHTTVKLAHYAEWQ